MEHFPLALLSFFGSDFVLVPFFSIIQLILNELFVSVSYLFNFRWLMMNDYEMLRIFSKYVKDQKDSNFPLKFI